MLKEWFTEFLPTPNPACLVNVLYNNVTAPQFTFLVFFNIFAVLGLSCNMWDLVPWPGIKPRPPALGAWSLSHGITWDVPSVFPYHLWPSHFRRILVSCYVEHLSIWIHLIFSHVYIAVVCFGQEYHQNDDASSSVPGIRRALMSMCLLTGDTSLDDLDKVISARCLPWKVTILLTLSF